MLFDFGGMFILLDANYFATLFSLISLLCSIFIYFILKIHSYLDDHEALYSDTSVCESSIGMIRGHLKTAYRLL